MWPWGSCDVKIENFSRSVSKKFLNLNLKSWNSYSLQVKYCKMFISQSENRKTKISKCNFAYSNPARVTNSLRFALSLNVSEISANLKFLNFLNFWNVQQCFVVMIDNHCDHQISSVSLYLLQFLSFKFKYWFFLKWPPFSQFWPDFYQKLISASFQYTGCSYKISFHAAVRPAPWPQDFFKTFKFFNFKTITLMKIKI